MIAISISEEQTLRNYFLLNNWNALIKSKKYLLVCTRETYEIILKLSKEKKLPFNHEIVNINLNETLSKNSKILFSISRNFSKSPSTYRLIFQDRENKQSTTSQFLIRLLVRSLAFIFPNLIYLIRKQLSKSLESKLYMDLFKSKNVSFALSVCITNTNDIFFLLGARNLNIATVATTRSWDNLTSHGALMVEPDIFISHSWFMNEQLVKYQKLSQKFTLINCRIPWYDPQFNDFNLLNRNILNSKKINYLYACTGASIFPNELDFIVSLEAKLCEYGISLTILQHPKSIHKVTTKSSHLKFRVFQYIDENLESTLQDYYSFLDCFDVIIGSGSTALLDALYLKKFIVGYFPDNDNYWSSIYRYVDYMYHYKTFINRLNIPCFKNEETLLNFIGNENFSKDKSNLESDYFFGSHFFQSFNLEQFLEDYE
jgi:hypothetical protein